MTHHALIPHDTQRADARTVVGRECGFREDESAGQTSLKSPPQRNSAAVGEMSFLSNSRGKGKRRSESRAKLPERQKSQAQTAESPEFLGKSSSGVISL